MAPSPSFFFPVVNPYKNDESFNQGRRDEQKKKKKLRLMRPSNPSSRSLSSAGWASQKTTFLTLYPFASAIGIILCTFTPPGRAKNRTPPQEQPGMCGIPHRSGTGDRPVLGGKGIEKFQATKADFRPIFTASSYCL